MSELRWILLLLGLLLLAAVFVFSRYREIFKFRGNLSLRSRNESELDDDGHAGRRNLALKAGE